jgi:hypothetical protein
MAHNIRVTEAEMEFVKDLIEAFSQGGIDININGIKADHDRR